MKNLMKALQIAGIGIVLISFASVSKNYSPPDLPKTAMISREPKLGYTSPSLPPVSEACEHIYDDGTWRRAYYYLNEDDVMAEEFLTGTACDLDTYFVSHIFARLLTWEDYPPLGWPDPDCDPFRVGVWLDSNGDGFPDEPPVFLDTVWRSSPNQSWISVNPLPLVFMARGQHFWVGFTNLNGGGQEGLCLDANTDYPQYKWGRENGTWHPQDYYPGDHMIRVFMGGNRFPTVTGPTSEAIDEEENLRFEVHAEDPDGHPVSISAENLPSGATCLTEGDRASFDWTPDFCQSGTYLPRFIVTDAGTPALSETLEVSITVDNVNRPPTISANPSMQWVSVGYTVTINISLFDPDWFQCHDDTVYPTLIGPGILTDYGNGTALYTWVPTQTDTGDTIVSFRTVDTYGCVDTTNCEIFVFPYPLRLSLSRIYAYPGQEHVCIPVLLSNPLDSVGAFEILIEYDITAFQLVEVTTPDSVYISPISPDAGWYYAPPGYPPEYFEVILRPGGYPNRVRVVGIMDMAWPPSTTPPIQPGVEQLLCCLVVNVSSLWDGHVSLTSFRTFDCGDNTLASPDGYTVWGPALEFASREICPERPDSLRVVGLQQGVLGIYEILIGDLNLNGMPYEIGDALVFVNYYIYGLSALVAPEIQGPASDVNGDGIWWTIGDLVMLINYMNEPPPSPPTLADDRPVSIFLYEQDKNELVLRIDSPVQVGGAFVCVEFDTSMVELGTTRLANSSREMTLSSNINGNEVRALVYSMEGKSIPAGDAAIFTIPYRLINLQSTDNLSDYIQLKETSFADIYGRNLAVAVSDMVSEPPEEEFALWENSPNPFQNETEITYTLPQECETSLRVYDASGRLVKNLFRGIAGRGTQSVRWDGIDESGRVLPSGVYFCIMDVGGFRQVRKLMILR